MATPVGFCWPCWPCWQQRPKGFSRHGGRPGMLFDLVSQRSKIVGRRPRRPAGRVRPSTKAPCSSAEEDTEHVGAADRPRGLPSSIFSSLRACCGENVCCLPHSVPAFRPHIFRRVLDQPYGLVKPALEASGRRQHCWGPLRKGATASRVKPREATAKTPPYQGNRRNMRRRAGHYSGHRHLTASPRVVLSVWHAGRALRSTIPEGPAPTKARKERGCGLAQGRCAKLLAC